MGHIPRHTLGNLTVTSPPPCLDPFPFNAAQLGSRDAFPLYPFRLFPSLWICPFPPPPLSPHTPAPHPPLDPSSLTSPPTLELRYPKQAPVARTSPNSEQDTARNLRNVARLHSILHGLPCPPMRSQKSRVLLHKNSPALKAQSVITAQQQAAGFPQDRGVLGGWATRRSSTDARRAPPSPIAASRIIPTAVRPSPSHATCKPSHFRDWGTTTRLALASVRAAAGRGAVQCCADVL